MSKGDKPVTYEEAHAPHHIAHRKGWLSLHTGEGMIAIPVAGEDDDRLESGRYDPRPRPGRSQLRLSTQTRNEHVSEVLFCSVNQRESEKPVKHTQGIKTAAACRSGMLKCI